jgi:hypothetical protein
MRAACHVAVAVAAAVFTLPLGLVSPAPAAAADGDGSVTCPPSLSGVPFTSEPEFAGTTRPLANDQGVLVRFSLFCPYARAGAAAVYELSLEWSLFAADDLQCEELEITSEEADGGGVQGVLDDPNVSARVSYQARSADDLPAVRDASTQLLADVPDTAFPCEGGPDAGVDGAVAGTDDEQDEDIGSGPVLVAGVVAGFVAIVVGGGMLVGRLQKRRRRKAAAPKTSGLQGLEVLRQTRPEIPPATQSPESCWARVAEMDRALEQLGAERDELAASAEQLAAEIGALDAGLATARAGVAAQQAHVAAIRNVAASDPGKNAYLASYAGLTTLAAAGTNLLAAGGRRAAALVPDEGVTAAAARVDEVARACEAAAEIGLEDSRYWLWADRRHAVAEALRVLAAVAPQQAELQRRLVVRVQRSGQRRHDLERCLVEALEAVDAVDQGLADLLDERNRQATTAQILEERVRGDLVPSP